MRLLKITSVIIVKLNMNLRVKKNIRTNMSQK